MITIILLHPSQNIPLQSWSFDQQETLSIGRSTDNDIVVYSAVVSRHHAKLKRNGEQWQCINMGVNGIFIKGEKVSQIELEDGMVIRLADTGPKIQVKLGKVDPDASNKKGNRKGSPLDDQINTFIRNV